MARPLQCAAEMRNATTRSPRSGAGSKLARALRGLRLSLPLSLPLSLSLAASAALVGCGESISCEDSGTDVHELRVELPVEPAVSFLLERCRLDQDACVPLCEMTRTDHLAPQLPEGPTDTPGGPGALSVALAPLEACDVKFYETKVEVKATFTSFNDACGVVDLPSPIP